MFALARKHILIYMKRFLFTLIALSTASLCFADPFAHLNDIPEQKTNTVLAEKLINFDTITYCIAAPDAPKASNLPEEDLNNRIRLAFKEWTYGIALRIRAAGRAEEFKDILAVLEKNINLKRLPACDVSEHPKFKQLYPDYKSYPQTADISVIRSTKYCREAMGNHSDFFTYDASFGGPFICLENYHLNMSAYTPSDYLPTLFTTREKQLAYYAPKMLKTLPYAKYTTQDQYDLWQTNRLFFYDDEPTFFAVITHEFGHAFGLADEYDDDDRDAYYSTTKHGEGLMRYSYGNMSCDEVDGMITLLDRFSNTKRDFVSFCDKNISFKNGHEVSPAKNYAQDKKEAVSRAVKSFGQNPSDSKIKSAISSASSGF